MGKVMNEGLKGRALITHIQCTTGSWDGENIVNMVLAWVKGVAAMRVTNRWFMINKVIHWPSSSTHWHLLITTLLFTGFGRGYMLVCKGVSDYSASIIHVHNLFLYSWATEHEFSYRS